MKNRLPPTWSKHLRTAQGSASKPPVHGPTDDQLLSQAVAFRERGQFREAEQLCVKILQSNPHHPQALYLAGTLAFDSDQTDLAILYLKKAVKEKPKDPYFNLALAASYEKAVDYELAVQSFHRALAAKPNLVGALCGLGMTHVKAGNAELALPFFEKALRIDADFKGVRIGYADALTSLGRMDEAAAYLKEAIARRAYMPAAYRALAASIKFTREPPELKSIIAELANPALAPVEATHLHQAAGKILNDLKRYDEAVDHFQQAKQVAGRDYDVAAYRRWVDAMIDLFSPLLLKAKTGLGDPSEVPVFILGMPRSGTTLTEQICASHPSVHGAGEISKMWHLAMSIGLSRASVGAFGESVLAMGKDRSRALAADYLRFVRKSSPGALRVTDKLTHNFELIGLIALILPNARIINCRRDPIDNCVSCFTTPDFNDKHGYNADLAKLGLYYREYDRLMRHWNAILPGRIHEVRYEAMIADPEVETRRLIDRLGLPWDDACLRFNESNRTVATPSRWQVRQPVYKTSVKRWKNYEHKIQPLIEALGDLAEV
ncbi:sulfotransferase [Mesorhizobium sp. KR9-304]|uniref:tetratricopeptide repeat-containing sulfotransferase family protein n=1 Tax=Mesorhizobium sp. KR9-304 TaxID=3156614 RepID=UPI0032B5B708